MDPASEDLTAALIEANGGKRVDVVFEMAGGRIFDQSLEALAPFGRMVTYGIASREPNQVPTGQLMRRSRSVHLAHLRASFDLALKNSRINILPILECHLFSF